MRSGGSDAVFETTVKEQKLEDVENVGLFDPEYTSSSYNVVSQLENSPLKPQQMTFAEASD